MKTLSQLKNHYLHVYQNKTLGDLLHETHTGYFFRLIGAFFAMWGMFFAVVLGIILAAWILVNVISPILGFIFT